MINFCLKKKPTEKDGFFASFFFYGCCKASQQKKGLLMAFAFVFFWSHLRIISTAGLGSPRLGSVEISESAVD